MRVHELSPPARGSGTGSWPATLAVIAWCLAVTLVSLPRAIQAGDAGEFATVMLAGGVPHPPGYPWMRVLGPIARGLSALGVPPASAAALPPALAGVAAWAVLHRVCVRFDRPWLGGVLIVLAATSPLVIAHVPDSEVWGLHLLFSAVFLRSAARSEFHGATRVQARRHAFRLGCLLGLAFGHHQTAVFLVPLAIAAALPAQRRAAEVAIHGCLGVAGVLVGLLSLVSLAIGSGGAWRWGDTQTAGGLLHHVLRRDYGTTQLSLHDDPVAATDTIARMLASAGEVFSAGLIRAGWFGGLLLLLTCIVVGATARRGASPTPSRTLAIGWVLSLLVASIGFAAIQNIDPNLATGAWILERFDLLPLLLWIPLLALGLGELADRLRPALAGVRPALPKAAVVTLALALLAAQLVAQLERGRPADDRSIEEAAIDLVRTPDPAGPALAGTELEGEPIRAIVIGTDDHRTFPVLYVQSVLGEGRHTLYVDASLFTRPWYRAQLRRRFPDLPEVDKPLRLIGALWSDPRFDRVPIYLANVFSRPASELSKVPEGLLWRVVPPVDHPAFDATQWTPEAIVARHLAACERMSIRPSDFPDLRDERAAWAHPWTIDLRHAYVEKAHALMRPLEASELADLQRDIARALATRVGEAP